MYIQENKTGSSSVQINLKLKWNYILLSLYINYLNYISLLLFSSLLNTSFLSHY